LQGVLNHGTQLGGKRLRPAMLLLFGKASGQLTEQHRVIATVVEMVHTATLVHDDVLDQADTRRHVPTVNAKWNEHTSILLGDYLFSQAYRLAATTSCTIACEKIGEAARLVCEGELRQVLCRDALDLDEATYVSIVAAKTGELCRVACELGTILSGASTEISAAASTFGNSLGIAFQIADDYLDLWGDQKTVGKTLGTDLEQGKMTLPLIRLLQTSNPTSQKAIRSILGGPSSERLERITPFLDASDAKDYTMECARRHYDTAVKSLACIPESEAKQSLLAIAKFSVSREF
jgi:octaprenyl-diphosphate synthase